MMNKEYKLKIKRNDIEPTIGRVLVAEPTTYDFFFSRSIVLLLEHEDREGSAGVILNKKISDNFKDIYNKSKIKADFPLYLGGPVDTNKLFVLHRLGDIIPKSFEVIPGLWWGGDVKTIYTLVNNKIANNNNLKVFQGYSGWAPMQLREEMKKNYWAVTELSIDEIFEMPVETMWKKCIENLGPEYVFWQHIPENPTFN